jgi:hypothetical protein
MNMEVQSTERIQRPQLLNVDCDIFLPAVLMPARCSFLTIAVVRVQGPRQRQQFRFHTIINGTEHLQYHFEDP